MTEWVRVYIVAEMRRANGVIDEAVKEALILGCGVRVIRHGLALVSAHADARVPAGMIYEIQEES